MISPGIEHTYTNKPFRIWQGIDKDTQIEIPSIRKLKNEDPKAYADRENEILAAYREGRVVRN